MSQIIVLDTHIWFWWINLEFDRFPLQWKERIETASKVGVSPVSVDHKVSLRQAIATKIHKFKLCSRRRER